MAVISNLEVAASSDRPWALQDLPPYRPVARKLMTLTSKDDVPLELVQKVLRTDAVFSAEVLHLANSPLIGTRSNIGSLLQAVIMLGLERLKALATTLALRAFLSTDMAPDNALRRCWRHNLATAIVCERLGRILHLHTDTCYTAGLLHDIGRLALLRAHPEDFVRILSMESTAEYELLQREKAVFDIDHCDAGRWILEHWEFPKELRDLVYLHHKKPGLGASDLSRVVYTGWQIADLVGFSLQHEPVAGDIAAIASELPAKAAKQVVAEIEWLAEDVAIKINAIECSLA
jgi:putative nucleotidyltransferase with HDIG domain